MRLRFYTFSLNFLILRGIERNMLKIYIYWSSLKYTLFFSDFTMNLKRPRQKFEK